MTKNKNGLQTASIILVAVAIALSVLVHPVQAMLYWHFQTFPATNDLSWIIEACTSLAGQVILLLGFIKSYNEKKPTTLLSIYMISLCASSLYTLITYPQLSIVTFIYLIVPITSFALYVFITVDYFRGFKLIKASFVLYALYMFPTLVGVLAINVYHAATLSEPYFVVYVKSVVTSVASLCIAAATLLYFFSHLKRALKKENASESM